MKYIFFKNNTAHSIISLYREQKLFNQNIDINDKMKVDITIVDYKH